MRRSSPAPSEVPAPSVSVPLLAMLSALSVKSSAPVIVPRLTMVAAPPTALTAALLPVIVPALSSVDPSPDREKMPLRPAEIDAPSATETEAAPSSCRR